MIVQPVRVPQATAQIGPPWLQPGCVTRIVAARMQQWADAAPRQSALRARRGLAHTQRASNPSSPGQSTAVVAVTAGGARGTHTDSGLLECTARLALSTARQVRALTGLTTEALTLPDSSPLGPFVLGSGAKGNILVGRTC